MEKHIFGDTKMKKILIALTVLLLSSPAMATDFEYISATGAKAMTATLTTTAISDNGDGTVRLTFGADHGFLAPSTVYITGTTNYSGVRYVTDIPAATTMDIVATYVAETPAGTDTVSVIFAPDFDGELVSVDIHLSAASATSENLTISRDSKFSSAYDVNLLTKNMNTIQDYIRTFDPPQKFLAGDRFNFAWANTNSRTWGLFIKFRRLQ